MFPFRRIARHLHSRHCGENEAAFRVRLRGLCSCGVPYTVCGGNGTITDVMLTVAVTSAVTCNGIIVGVTVPIAICSDKTLLMFTV